MFWTAPAEAESGMLLLYAILIRQTVDFGAAYG